MAGLESIIKVSDVDRQDAMLQSEMVHQYVTTNLNPVPDPEKVWVVYFEDSRNGENAAAFTHQQHAKMLVHYTRNTAKLVLESRTDVNIEIDKYQHEASHAMRPYYITLVDGAFDPLELESNNGLFKICEIELSKDKKTLTGTFWSSRKVLAIEEAQLYWHKVITQF